MTSFYPNQLDSIQNLPTVADNLTSLGSSIINNMRDAILALEQTIGVNPQANFSDLATRLSVLLNADGSINKQALQATGFIAGPLRDQDFDPNASIAESKLALNYPTSMLFDSIKIVEARTQGLIDLVISSNSGLQTHTSSATGAHRAMAIAVDTQTTPVSSSTATTKIDQSNVQQVLQQIYNSHINFSSGANSNFLTLTNSPHQANQIFYDNRNTSLPTNSVQGAIDNVYLKGTGFITDHQRQLHSNGIQRRVEAVDTTNASGIQRGRIILSSFTAQITYPDVNSDTSIFLNVPIQAGASTQGVSLNITNLDGTTELIPIDVDDSLQITDPLGIQYALVPITDLKINNVTNATTGAITQYLVGINAFYNPDVFQSLFTANNTTSSNPVLQITCSVYKKIDVQGNSNGLNCIARVLKPNSIQEPNLSSSVSEIQIAHPNAATIISQGFNASALGRRGDGYFDRNFSSMLTLVVDGATYQVQIVPMSPVDITLDTCVSKANLEFLKQNIPATAFRIGQEMAIAHNWPDDIFIAGVRHTLKIISGGGVDASKAAGFSYIANTTIYGSAGNSFMVNGVQRSSFRIKMPQQGTTALGKSGFSIQGNVIIFSDPSNNPLVAGVRVGDIVNIQGLSSISVTTKLDGSRRINNITSNTITVDGNAYPLDVQLTSGATLVVYSNIVSLDNLAHRFQTDFANLDPNLSQNAVVQIYMNSAGETDFHERLIYPNAATLSGTAYGGASTLAITNLATDNHGIYIVDCSRGLVGSTTGTNALLSLQFDNQNRVFATFGCQNSPSDAYTISTSLHGPAVNITGDGIYQLIDETGLNFITLQSVKAFNLVNTTILSNIPNGQFLTYVLPIVKFEQINEFENLLLCNVYYNSQANQIPLLNGDLALADKRYTGTIGTEQIRDDVVKKYISGPFGETRGDGVAAGLFVPSDPIATQNITNDKVVYVNGGVVYVQGVRYEISSQQIYVDPATLDISQYGADGYFPGSGAPPAGDGSYKNGYIRYYVFVDHVGRLQTTSRLNLPASLPFVPLAKVVLTTHGLLNNSPNIISINVVDFRLFISRVDDKMEITVGSIPQQPTHFHSIAAAFEYVDNMRYNDVITGRNIHIRPTIIRVLEGTYQEATTLDVPPFVTVKGENAHSVRIRPPVNLLGRQIANNNLQIDDTVNNQFVFNINMLPEGTSAKIENICFDLNTSTTTGSLTVPGSNKAGAVKITWFNNASAVTNIQQQLVNTPSIVDVKNCIFILDGPAKSTGIQNVFASAAPIVTGGLTKFSYSYNLQYSKIYFANYFNYKAAPYATPTSNTILASPPTAPGLPGAPPSSPNSPEPGPAIGSSPPTGLDTNPPAPFTPEDAVFTDPNAPLGYNHGGIVNIDSNTFVITDGYGSICIDRFYDTTTAAGYLSATPVPVSNTRMSAFKIANNSFKYYGSLLNQSLILPSLNGIIPTTTPANTTTGTAAQEALRDQIYDLMIHKDLRGRSPLKYPTGRIYPDPKDGYNIPDGYYIPPAGGKVTEFMVISNNTPTGLNIETAPLVGFLSDTQDSIARDNHGGGVKFGTITVPASGMPIVIDRSMDWHDRYVFAYATNALTDIPQGSNAFKNRIYGAAPAIQNISSSVSFINSGAGGGMLGQSSDAAMKDYGAATGAHGLLFGYTARLSGDLVSIKHPSTAQFPGWSSIKYLGTFSITSDFTQTVALVVMPNGELAILHAGLQNPNATNLPNNTRLVQTSDSYPAGDGGGSSADTSRTNAKAVTVALVIQFSPKLNVLTTSQIDANTTINNLDNWGKSFGRVG